MDPVSSVPESPADLSDASVHLVADELAKLYDIPLVAPRAFRRVARRCWSAEVATAAAQPRLPSQSQLPPTVQRPAHTVLQPGRGPPPADLTAAAAVVEDVEARQMTKASATEGQEATPASAISVAATRPIVAAYGRSGFLTWEARSSCSNSNNSVPASQPPPQAPTSMQEPPPQPQTHSQEQQQQQALAGLRSRDRGRSVEGEGEAKRTPEAAAANLSATGLASLSRVTSKGSGARPLRADPRDFPSLHPHHLASLLLDCAAKKIPLRLSALQAYADQVSYRASELTADELASALEGLCEYGFTSAPGPGAATPTPAAAAAPSWPPSTGGTRGRPSSAGGGAGSSALRRSSPTTWADRILAALLAEEAENPAPAPPSATAKTGPASGAAAAGPGAPGRGDTAGGDRRYRRGRGGAESTASVPHRPRVAALQPSRVVDLTRLLVQLHARPRPGWTADFLRATSHLVPHMAGGDLVRLLELLPALQAGPPEATWWHVVLDTWLTSGPPPVVTARCSSAITAGFSDAVHHDGVARLAVSTAADASSPAPSSRRTQAEGFSRQRAAITGGDSRRVRPGHASDAEDAEDSSEHPGAVSAAEVRSAVMYGVLALGLPQGPDGPALATRLRVWCQASLYDIARQVLLSRQLVLARGEGGSHGSGDLFSEGSAAPHTPAHGCSKSTRSADAKLDCGDGAAAGGASGAAAGGDSPPPPPPARAIAQALAALPAVMPGASAWAADPASGGCGVFAVLVASLEPRLGELSAGLMVELLRGFSSSRLHPGPRFLLLHSLALKGRTGDLRPRQLLQAARVYTKLGLAPRGGLRAAVLRARETLRRESLKTSA